MFSLIFQKFLGRDDTRAQAFQAAFGESGPYRSLASNSEKHAPCEIAADLTPEDAARKAAILREAGIAVDVIPTAEVRDVKHRARDCWPTHRASTGETFTDLWGCLVVCGVSLGLREQVGQWRESVPVARFWEFELFTNHEHPTNGLDRRGLRKARERGAELRAALAECFPERWFLLVYRSGQVSFCQFTQELALGITPEPRRLNEPLLSPSASEDCFCETCERTTSCVARRELDAEFPNAHFADCAICGSEVILWSDQVVDLVTADDAEQLFPLPEVSSDAWERPLSEARLPASFAELVVAVGRLLHPSKAWSQAAFRRYLGRDVDALDRDGFRLAQTLLQIEELSAMLLSYRIRQLTLPPERQDQSPLTPERLGISKSSPLYHPARRALAPVTVATLRDGKTASHALINATEERYTAGRRLDPTDAVKYTVYEGRFGYGVRDTQGRTFWTTLPNGQAVRVVNDVTFHAANSWTCKSYGAATSLKFVREQGSERCIACTYLCDEQKRVVAQHRRLFCGFHELDIEPNPTIEMRLSDDILKLRSDVFVWGVFLRGQNGDDLADNAFDLLPGIPYSLPWDAKVCGAPTVWQTGNSLFR